MNPEWRSYNVVMICRSMLETRTWDALPVLGDALIDACCTDQALIAECQNTKEPILAERLVNIVHSEETAAAAQWIDEYASNLQEPYEKLIQAGIEWTKDGEYYYGETYEDEDGNRYSGKFEGIGTNPEFWPHFQLVTGLNVPSDRQHNFFSCSC